MKFENFKMIQISELSSVKGGGWHYTDGADKSNACDAYTDTKDGGKMWWEPVGNGAWRPIRYA